VLLFALEKQLSRDVWLLTERNFYLTTEAKPMTANELITKDDLREFKSELLTEIKKLVQLDGQGQSKQWLKSNEVRKLLKISPGTLQHLRINGTLSFTQIGSIL
jgi:hypothetical protein